MSTSFNYPFRVANREDYQSVLKELNNKIDSVKKRVSYFDFYNITTAVTDVNNFAAQINSLPFNEALVVNTSPFYYSGESYSTGDVIIKNNTGVLHHIKAQTGGVYYPEQVTQNETTGEYSFIYKYSDSMPTEEISEANLGSKVDFAETIVFNSIKPNNTESTNVYGEYGTLNNTGTYAFLIQVDKNLNDILPYIQFFFCENGIPQEQIFIDYTLTKEAGENSARY
jgi:hypothetical protein